MFDKYPDIDYTGIEPAKNSYNQAVKDFGGLPNKKFYNQFAYEGIGGFGEFDVCISLSVLEHVKGLERMLQKSIAAVKPGGHIIHWYDLGHALHPGSFKEMLQVFLGNHLPYLLGEHKFVRYLDPEEVVAILKKYNVMDINVSSHQSGNIKSCLKRVETKDDYLAVTELIKWEYVNQTIISRIPKKNRERLYPSVLVRGLKDFA